MSSFRARPRALSILPFTPPADPTDEPAATRMFEVEVPPSAVVRTLQIRIEGPAETIELIRLHISDITGHMD